MRTLLIDNYDSFTFNLFHLLAQVNGVEPTILRNDEVRWDEVDPARFDAIVISPGPGRPDRSRDVGISVAAITQSRLPVLGVCLGHQALCQMVGASVLRSPEPRHGRTSLVRHTGEGIFSGIPSPFAAVRYHSLEVSGLPPTIEPIAWADDGALMGVADRTAPRWGVQFHPESILTHHGRRLLENFRALAEDFHGRTGGAGGGGRAALGDPPQDNQAPRARHHHPRSDIGGARGELKSSTRLGLEVRCLDLEVDAAMAFADLYGGSESAFWLDSSAHLPGRSRFSIFGDASGPLAEVVTYDVERREVTVQRGDDRSVEPGPLLDWLEASLAGREVPDPDLPFDFNLGYVGYLGYELKAECGAEPAHSAETPDAGLVFADRAIVVDHDEHRTYILALDDGTDPAATAAWMDATQQRISWPVASDNPVDAVADDADSLDQGSLPIEFRHAPDTYLELIATCRERIHEGESYEICLTNALTVPIRIDPLATYLSHRRANPAPHAAYLRLAGISVLSASPERFLRVDRNRVVETRPIKGTSRRGDDPVEDRRLAMALGASEKDRAENLMIVDLSRHDLGAVCETGTVDVPELFAVESYATVHQLVSTVRGRLRPECTPIDGVRAAFPGGSMTGAPKRRTMEIIDGLEAGPRGIYSGALGYIACNGTTDLSIVIRTMVAHRDRVTFGVGGAIVAISDPESELRETMLKARAAISTLRTAHGLSAEHPDPRRPEPTLPIR